MENGYKVAQKDATHEFIEKKSRFISYLACVHTESEAKEFIDEIRARHRDATHNCVAYRLREPRVERFSDDGEPAGTAGMPMLEVLKKEDVYDVCVVVTRYFGGILLGGGGLIRAYSKGVSDVLAKSGFATRLESVTLSLTFTYSAYQKVQKLLETTVHTGEESEFSENVTMRVTLRADEYDSFLEKVRDLLCGDVEICEISRGFDSFK